MYDTLMQMGRWFGYRPGYLDVCRLYLTQSLEDWFTVITEAAEELREEFNIAIQMNLTPREYGLKVMHHPALMVTSPVKMRAAQEIALNLSLSGTLQETINFFRDDTKLQNNLDALSNFLKNMGPNGLNLAEQIEEIDQLIGDDSQTQILFDSLLLNVGYLAKDAERYADKFRVQKAVLYPVDDQFPCLTRHNVPVTIASARYTLQLEQMAINTVPFNHFCEEVIHE